MVFYDSVGTSRWLNDQGCSFMSYYLFLLCLEVLVAIGHLLI